MFKPATLFIALITVAVNCIAAPTIKDYGTLPTASAMAVSPDGNTIAFRLVQDGNDTLNVISLAEKKALPGLNLSDIQPKSIRFLNNDTIYLEASTFGRVSGFRGKFETSTGFSFNIKTEKVRQLLIPGKDAVYPGQTGLGEIVGFSKDRKYIYMPAFVGTTDVILGKSDDPNYSLLKVRIDKKARPKRLTNGTPHTTDFFVGSEGNLVAEERYHQRSNIHSIWAKKGKKLEEIYSETAEIRYKSWVGLTPDEKSIVFLDVNKKTGRSDYFLLNIKSGKISSANLGTSDADIEAVIFGNNRVIHGVRYSGFTPSYKFFDNDLNARVQKILANFPEQSVWIYDQSPDWKHIVIYVEGSDYIGDYYLASENKDLMFLTQSRSNIAKGHL